MKLKNDSKDCKFTDEELDNFISTHKIIEKACEFSAFNGYNCYRYLMESDADQTKYELRITFDPKDDTHHLITGPNKIEINYSI